MKRCAMILQTGAKQTIVKASSSNRYQIMSLDYTNSAENGDRFVMPGHSRCAEQEHAHQSLGGATSVAQNTSEVYDDRSVPV